MKNIFLILISTIFFVSCSSKHEPLPTVAKVNIDKYLGTWYEIARLPHSFEKNCKNVKANYSLKKNGDIKVINSCTKIDTNKTSSAKGIAYSTDESNSKLKVSFFRPFYGDYWIVMLDKNYDYAVVAAPSREYLWILSRNKNLDKSLTKDILVKLENLNFDTNKLIWTIQE